MALFKVACTFEISAELVVEAENMEEAEKLADKTFDPSDYSPNISITATSTKLEELTPDELAEIVKE